MHKWKRNTCLFVLLLALPILLNACSGGGAGGASGTTKTVALLQTLQNPTLTAGDTSVVIQWSQTAGASSYDIYWSNAPGVTKETGNRIQNVASPYTHAGLTNNTTYYYIISALGPEGELALSTQLSATPQVQIPGAPPAPTVTAGDLAATIEWPLVSGAVSYNIYWSNTPGVTKANGTKRTGVTTPFTHTGLTNGTAYYYVVTAVNPGGGESSESLQLSATPGAAVADVPQNPMITATDSSATIQWSAVTGAVSYNVYWSNTPGVTKANGTKIAGVTSPFTHFDLAENPTEDKTYYYVVTAVKADGTEGAESPQVAATPLLSRPAAPQNLTLSIVNSTATLQWSPVTGATRYFVYWSNKRTTPKDNRSRITSFTNSLVHGPLNRGETYYYYVTSVGPGGESAVSSEVSVTPGLLGDAQLIANSDTEDARAPQVSIDNSGNAIAVWHQDNGASTSIWARRYDATARIWGAPQLIETNDEGVAVFPRIAVDGAGNFIVVWLQNELFNGNWAANVWSNRYDAATGAWGTAQRIKANDGQGALDYQIAVDSATGAAIATWDQYDGVRYNIWVNHYSRTAGTWGTPRMIESNDAGTAAYPEVAIDGSGNAVAVWQQSDGVKFNVWANRYSAGAWGTAQPIEGNAGDAYLPKIAVDAGGNALVVWQQSDGVRFNIWANRYSGGNWGTAVAIQAGLSENAVGAHLAMDSSGNAIAAWHQGTDTGQQVWTAKFNVTSGSWEAAWRMNTAGTSVNARVSFDGDDNATVVWLHSSGDIWSAKYTPAAGWDQPLADFRFTGLPFTGLPVIAVNANGNSMAVWEMYSADRYNIWSNRSL